VVTGRLVIDRLRVRGRSTSVAEVPENSRLGRDTADVVVARDEARTALDALDAMPARQASLLWAREVEGQSYEELCERFGMTEPAVRSVLTRARKALRKEYALRGGTLPVGGLAVLAPWIAGLTWAHKLRSVVGKVTAPAALAAIGVTTLGGLILSPFGVFPTTGAGTFSPERAIVSSVSTSAADPTPPHPLLVSAAPATSGRASHAPAGTDGAVRSTVDRLASKIDNTCTSRDGSAPGAGGTSCTPVARNSYLYVDLPDNPTGRRQLGAELAANSGPHPVTCADIPTTPVVKCSTQGAQS
jgi:hypothetical protein